MQKTPIKEYFRPGIDSLRAMWPPMLLVQFVCIITVIGYFQIPAITDFLDRASDFKDQNLFAFILGSSFIAGALIPEVAKFIVGRKPKYDGEWLKLVLYTGIVYSALGILVYYMFKFQVILFGDTGDFPTVLKKVLFDQLIFSPFLSIPLGVGLFKWRQAKFQFSAWSQVIKPDQYKANVFPALIMCWSYWGPITSGMYWLPERIQFVVSAFCQAAWSLLFVFMVQSPNIENPPPE